MGEFTGGMFARHTARAQGCGCPILLTPWSQIAKSMKPPLKIDTSWNPGK
ncbi:MAG: hypothetical protein HN350_05670 [Phycisphaerales bacterium]|nr:hypothetical protein [Phycisphaerales bacterium]